MTERSRRRYDRNRRQRVRILPAGQGEIFTTQRDRANFAESVPAVRKKKRDPVPVPGSVDLNCPRCGHRFPLGRVHKDGIEFRGTCGGCMRHFIYMMFSRVTQTLTIKAAK